MPIPESVTAFSGPRQVAAGSIGQVTLTLHTLLQAPPPAPFLVVFDDQTGKVVDLDLRGPADAIVARYPTADATIEQATPATRGPGRPRLGVVAREVTLLPHHWEWLATQRGGASATLRRLVEEARRTTGGADHQRLVEERTYRFIVAIAGDLPGFEEATRALFAHDHELFAERISEWPGDVREYAMRLLRGGTVR